MSIRYQSPISNASSSLQVPIKFPSSSYQVPLKLPSPTPQQEHNFNHSGMLLLTVNSSVVYCMADVYLHISECLLHNIIITSFKLARIALKTSISMAKQSQ